MPQVLCEIFGEGKLKVAFFCNMIVLFSDKRWSWVWEHTDFTLMVVDIECKSVSPLYEYHWGLECGDITCCAISNMRFKSFCVLAGG